MSIFDPLSIPLGKLMHFIYYTVTFENYGFALILFTLLTRLAMLPLTIKQYQGTAKMQKLNPRLEELKRQYGTDKKRLQEETMKLYQEEKVNPAGGCLPLLIQFPILFSLYPVITRPLYYMIGKTKDQVAAIQELFNSLTGNTRPIMQEMEVINYFKINPSAMTQAEAAGLLKPADLINMNFLGLDLSKIPTYRPEILFSDQSAIFLPLLLIPIIGVLSTYISGKISMASSAAQSTQNEQAAGMGKSMQLIGPVMTLIFSFQLPAGVLVYWIAGYLIQIVQQLFINKYVLKLGNIFTGKPAPGSANAAAKGALPGSTAGAAKGAASNAAIGASIGALPGHAAGKSKGVSQGTAKGASPGAAPGKSAVAGGYRANNNDNYTGAISVSEGFSSGADNEGVEGGSMFNRMVGFAGSVGVGKSVSDRPGGIVHGGVFESRVRIPGITGIDDGSVPDGEESDSGYDGRYGADGYTADDGDGRSEGGRDADFWDSLYGSGASGVNAGAKPGNAAKPGDATKHGRPEGDQYNNQAPAQRAHGADTRSSTNKNYGSQKRRKKK